MRKQPELINYVYPDQMGYDERMETLRQLSNSTEALVQYYANPELSQTTKVKLLDGIVSQCNIIKQLQ